MAILLTSGVALVLIALLVLALRYGSTTITETRGNGCLFPEAELPDGELTREVAAELHEVHRYCTCRIHTLSCDILDATGGPIGGREGGHA